MLCCSYVLSPVEAVCFNIKIKKKFKSVSFIVWICSFFLHCNFQNYSTTSFHYVWRTWLAPVHIQLNSFYRTVDVPLFVGLVYHRPFNLKKLASGTVLPRAVGRTCTSIVLVHPPLLFASKWFNPSWRGKETWVCKFQYQTSESLCCDLLEQIITKYLWELLFIYFSVILCC
jgi:hypothetical protein